MKFTGKLKKFTDNSLWGHHLPIPADIAEIFVKGDRRVLLHINGHPPVHCALTSGGDGTWFITASKDLCKRLKLEPGDAVNLEIEKDESKYGIALPPEIAELWELDLPGKEVFHSLTPGKQRSLLYIIGKPKSSDTRLRKALMITDYLKSVNGNLDFKEMNAFMKEKKSEY